MLSINAYQDFNPATIPSQTGVYLYKDINNTIIYCGKAKNLRARIKSYFSSQHLLPLKTRRLVTHIKHIDWIIVDNEVEALLLENRLIKQHQPKYNILLKDSKTFAYIALTKDNYPRIFSTRKPNNNMDIFGAYTDNNLRYELQNMAISFFKLRDCKTLPKKACLNFYINRCAAPCINNISQADYAAQVLQAKAFLAGDIKTTVQQLTQKMQQAANELQFERALEWRNQLTRLQALQQKQNVDNLNKKNQDVFAFYKQMHWLYITQFGVKKGVLLGKQTFKIECDASSELEFLKAFYRKNPLPHEIIVNSLIWQDDNDKSNIEAFFSELRGSAVLLTLPQRGNKLALMHLAEKNTQANLSVNSALFDLQTALQLTTLPRVIECFDISNLGNTHIVCGMTQFIDMKANKKGFRRFQLKTVTQADDFASIYEAVTRRYSRLIREQKPLPDLIMIDGGAGQVSSALEALSELNVVIPLIGLAKKNEEIYLPDGSAPLVFNKNNRMMLLLRQIRDSTHDFALGYHRKKRQMHLRTAFEKN